jgi:hypothetical protein
MKKIAAFTLLITSTFLLSCSPDQEVKPDPEVTISIRNQFGNAEMQLEKPFLTSHGVGLTFSKYMYYISNIRLRREDGTWWREKESYHLVDVDESGNPMYKLKLENLPVGKYSEIMFGVGVDELRNHQGEQDGALDPLNGMLWTWEVGYVFLKVEGFYESSGSRGAMVMHVGRNECYREVSLTLPEQNQSFSSGGRYDMTIKADAQKIFGGFSGASYNLEPPANNAPVQVHHGANAVKLADNYATMFSLAGISPR